MIYALSLGEKVGIKRDKKKIHLFCLLDRKKKTFELVYLATTFKVQNLKKNI